ncbi:hypothetical protein ACWKWN_18385 [Microbacterium trichothecenolyticum]
MNRLSREKLLGVELSSICSRNRYSMDAAPVIAELRGRAGNRIDILAEAAGLWVGYFADEYTRTLADALLEIDGVGPWIEIGRKRRGMPPHKTP